MQRRLFWIVFGLSLVFLVAIRFMRVPPDFDPFTRLMTLGKGYLESGDATNAASTYAEAVKLVPEDVDARLNLANAMLLAGDSQGTIEQAKQALSLDHNNAAAFYLLGCAYLRLNQAEPAIQAFQSSQKINPAVTALNFQLGLAFERAGHSEDAIREFETLLQFDPGHLSAHYRLGQLYQRAGRAADAAQELQKHQELLAKNPRLSSGPAALERCVYTEPRLAFTLEQPQPRGVSVRFVDATASAFPHARAYHAPMAVLDYAHDGRNSLFVTEGESAFRLLNNQQGRFEPLGDLFPGKTNAAYRLCLVGDLDNDRVEDVVVLGERASQVFKFGTNGQARDFTLRAGLKDLKGRDGLLADLDFTGKLDLLTVSPDGQGLRDYRNLGNFYFKENTTNSGLPATLPGIEHLTMEDWNNEDLPGVLLTRTGHAPAFYSKQRAGPFLETNSPGNWPVGTVVVTGDLNNDLRPDLIIAEDSKLTLVFGGIQQSRNLELNGLQAKGILLVDYDNDGWLDIIAYGNDIRVWRNLGKAGFADVTAELGLDKIGQVDSIVAADFDNDGDTDLILSSPTGLQFWRNDGGNANKLLKLRLVGNRSNSSALGVRVELSSGRWRTVRTLKQLPLEIGVGRHDKLDVLKIGWFDLATTLVGVAVEPQALTLPELTMPTGSCPYLYAWDGHRFKFVTDILGAAPLGLPLSETQFIDADPEEFIALGSDQELVSVEGAYQLRITEELREVLYLDQARLVVVDHPAGTEVHPTSKLLPGKPFPPHEIWTLRPIAALRKAIRSDGLDVTKALARADGLMVSPPRLREPQLRGLAEPYSITMDFGELPASQPLVLVLTGWLRFGGGMANVAASLDPSLPFPFPTLEAELPDASWKPVQVNVGAPAGKTKTILVDLQNKLPAGARRLRLTTAFEIHWDSVSLCVKAGEEKTLRFTMAPTHADLQWRGFSDFAPLPDTLPLTPEYDRVRFTPPWKRAVSGWCTRYGPVDELVRDRDDALVLLNGGDELSLSFPARDLPPKRPGFDREFFLYVVGWDKDEDFHVGQGWRVEPLPYRGMDDQAYGREPGPARPLSDWMRRYNTRWVGPLVLSQNK